MTALETVLELFDDSHSSVMYFTIADSDYFLGAAALINSLELTGNHGSVVVVDAGLEPWQRERLSVAATVIPLDAPAGLTPVYYKSYMGSSIEGDVLVYIDSDIIVTDSLAEVISLAAAGRSCRSGRPFGALLRRVGRCAPACRGLAAAGVREFGIPGACPRLLACLLPAVGGALRSDTDEAPACNGSYRPTLVQRNPRAYHDQDALNAMLMSELPAEALALIDGERVAASAEMPRVRCADAATLDCRLGQHRTLILHYMTSPKPWQRSGWITTSNDAYVRLLARLLGAGDVPISINDEEVPVGYVGATASAGCAHRGLPERSRHVPTHFRHR